MSRFILLSSHLFALEEQESKQGKKKKTGKYLQLFTVASLLLLWGEETLKLLDPILWPGVEDDPWALQHCGKEMTGDMFLKVKWY